MDLTDVDSCTLPTAERPLRRQEFADLFADHLVSGDRAAHTRASLRLAGADGLAGRVRDLAARETACCSFFAFDVTEVADGDVLLEVSVPPAYADVLTALVGLAGDRA